MSGKEELPKELKAVEAALAAPAPLTDGANCDRLMFLARPMLSAWRPAEKKARPVSITFPRSL